ncbi:MAG TPA: GNAT family N-acetyltransferase [Anaerolineales bacterium]|nr:GNAT family N-acetyltransferase [Anaerolineales bacterium]
MKSEPDLTILETPRLRLRHTRPDDIPALVAMWSDLEVTRHMGGPRDEGTLRKVFAESADDPFAEAHDLWPVEEKSSGEVVGDCGLLLKEIDGQDELELVSVITRSRWGRGYATEMAEALKRHGLEKLENKRLVSLIDPENTVSRRVAEKIGMRLEKEVLRPGGNIRLLFVVEDL